MKAVKILFIIFLLLNTILTENNNHVTQLNLNKNFFLVSEEPYFSQEEINSLGEGNIFKKLYLCFSGLNPKSRTLILSDKSESFFALDKVFSMDKFFIKELFQDDSLAIPLNSNYDEKTNMIILKSYELTKTLPFKYYCLIMTSKSINIKSLNYLKLTVASSYSIVNRLESNVNLDDKLKNADFIDSKKAKYIEYNSVENFGKFTFYHMNNSLDAAFLPTNVVLSNNIITTESIFNISINLTTQLKENKTIPTTEDKAIIILEFNNVNLLFNKNFKLENPHDVFNKDPLDDIEFYNSDDYAGAKTLFEKSLKLSPNKTPQIKYLANNKIMISNLGEDLINRRSFKIVFNKVKLLKYENANLNVKTMILWKNTNSVVSLNNFKINVVPSKFTLQNIKFYHTNNLEILYNLSSFPMNLEFIPDHNSNNDIVIYEESNNFKILAVTCDFSEIQALFLFKNQYQPYCVYDETTNKITIKNLNLTKDNKIVIKFWITTDNPALPETSKIVVELLDDQTNIGFSNVVKILSVAAFQSENPITLSNCRENNIPPSCTKATLVKEYSGNFILLNGNIDGNASLLNSDLQTPSSIQNFKDLVDLQKRSFRLRFRKNILKSGSTGFSNLNNNISDAIPLEIIASTSAANVNLTDNDFSLGTHEFYFSTNELELVYNQQCRFSWISSNQAPTTGGSNNFSEVFSNTHIPTLFERINNYTEMTLTKLSDIPDNKISFNNYKTYTGQTTPSLSVGFFHHLVRASECTGSGDSRTCVFKAVPSSLVSSDTEVDYEMATNCVQFKKVFLNKSIYSSFEFIKTFKLKDGGITRILRFVSLLPQPGVYSSTSLIDDSEMLFKNKQKYTDAKRLIKHSHIFEVAANTFSICLIALEFDYQSLLDNREVNTLNMFLNNLSLLEISDEYDNINNVYNPDDLKDSDTDLNSKIFDKYELDGDDNLFEDYYTYPVFHQSVNELTNLDTTKKEESFHLNKFSFEQSSTNNNGFKAKGFNGNSIKPLNLLEEQYLVNYNIANSAKSSNNYFNESKYTNYLSSRLEFYIPRVLNDPSLDNSVSKYSNLLYVPLQCPNQNNNNYEISFTEIETLASNSGYKSNYFYLQPKNENEEYLKLYFSYSIQSYGSFTVKNITPSWNQSEPYYSTKLSINDSAAQSSINYKSYMILLTQDPVNNKTLKLRDVGNNQYLNSNFIAYYNSNTRFKGYGNELFSELRKKIEIGNVNSSSNTQINFIPRSSNKIKIKNTTFNYISLIIRPEPSTTLDFIFSTDKKIKFALDGFDTTNAMIYNEYNLNNSIGIFIGGTNTSQAANTKYYITNIRYNAGDSKYDFIVSNPSTLLKNSSESEYIYSVELITKNIQNGNNMNKAVCVKVSLNIPSQITKVVLGSRNFTSATLVAAVNFTADLTLDVVNDVYYITISITKRNTSFNHDLNVCNVDIDKTFQMNSILNTYFFILDEIFLYYKKDMFPIYYWSYCNDTNPLANCDAGNLVYDLNINTPSGILAIRNIDPKDVYKSAKVEYYQFEEFSKSITSLNLKVVSNSPIYRNQFLVIKVEGLKSLRYENSSIITQCNAVLSDTLEKEKEFFEKASKKFNQKYDEKIVNFAKYTDDSNLNANLFIEYCNVDMDNNIVTVQIVNEILFLYDNTKRKEISITIWPILGNALNFNPEFNILSYFGQDFGSSLVFPEEAHKASEYLPYNLSSVSDLIIFPFHHFEFNKNNFSIDEQIEYLLRDSEYSFSFDAMRFDNFVSLNNIYPNIPGEVAKMTISLNILDFKESFLKFFQQTPNHIIYFIDNPSISLDEINLLISNNNSNSNFSNLKNVKFNEIGIYFPEEYYGSPPNNSNLTCYVKEKIVDSCYLDGNIIRITLPDELQNSLLYSLLYVNELSDLAKNYDMTNYTVGNLEKIDKFEISISGFKVKPKFNYNPTSIDKSTFIMTLSYLSFMDYRITIAEAQTTINSDYMTKLEIDNISSYPYSANLLILSSKYSSLTPSNENTITLQLSIDRLEGLNFSNSEAIKIDNVENTEIIVVLPEGLSFKTPNFSDKTVLNSKPFITLTVERLIKNEISSTTPENQEDSNTTTISRYEQYYTTQTFNLKFDENSSIYYNRFLSQKLTVQEDFYLLESDKLNLTINGVINPTEREFRVGNIDIVIRKKDAVFLRTFEMLNNEISMKSITKPSSSTANNSLENISIAETLDNGYNSGFGLIGYHRGVVFDYEKEKFYINTSFENTDQGNVIYPGKFSILILEVKNTHNNYNENNFDRINLYSNASTVISIQKNNQIVKKNSNEAFNSDLNSPTHTYVSNDFISDQSEYLLNAETKTSEKVFFGLPCSSYSGIYLLTLLNKNDDLNMFYQIPSIKIVLKYDQQKIPIRLFTSINPLKEYLSESTLLLYPLKGKNLFGNQPAEIFNDKEIKLGLGGYTYYWFGIDSYNLEDIQIYFDNDEENKTLESDIPNIITIPAYKNTTENKDKDISQNSILNDTTNFTRFYPAIFEDNLKIVGKKTKLFVKLVNNKCFYLATESISFLPYFDIPPLVNQFNFNVTKGNEISNYFNVNFENSSNSSSLLKNTIKVNFSTIGKRKLPVTNNLFCVLYLTENQGVDITEPSNDEILSISNQVNSWKKSYFYQTFNENSQNFDTSSLNYSNSVLSNLKTFSHEFTGLIRDYNYKLKCILETTEAYVNNRNRLVEIFEFSTNYVLDYSDVNYREYIHAEPTSTPKCIEIAIKKSTNYSNFSMNSNTILQRMFNKGFYNNGCVVVIKNNGETISNNFNDMIKFNKNIQIESIMKNSSSKRLLKQKFNNYNQYDYDSKILNKFKLNDFNIKNSSKRFTQAEDTEFQISCFVQSSFCPYDMKNDYFYKVINEYVDKIDLTKNESLYVSELSAEEKSLYKSFSLINPSTDFEIDNVKIYFVNKTTMSVKAVTKSESTNLPNNNNNNINDINNINSTNNTTGVEYLTTFNINIEISYEKPKALLCYYSLIYKSEIDKILNNQSFSSEENMKILSKSILECNSNNSILCSNKNGFYPPIVLNSVFESKDVVNKTVSMMLTCKQNIPINYKLSRPIELFSLTPIPSVVFTVKPENQVEIKSSTELAVESYFKNLKLVFWVVVILLMEIIN